MCYTFTKCFISENGGIVGKFQNPPQDVSGLPSGGLLVVAAKCVGQPRVGIAEHVRISRLSYHQEKKGL